MDTYSISIESFIGFCDNMIIAEEGFLSTIKNKLKQALLTLVKVIEKLIKKCKDSKLKRTILNLLQKAKRALGDVDDIKTDNDAQEMKETIDDIQEEVEIIKDELEGVNEREEFATEDKTTDYVKVEKNRGIQRFVEYNGMNREMIDKLNEIFGAMQYATTFSEYKTNLDRFKQILKLPEKSTLSAIHFSYSKSNETGKINLYYTQDASPLTNKNYKLLHTSKYDNIQALNPTWKSEDGYYFNSPRVYFASVPVSRMGSVYKEKDGVMKDYDENTVHLYTPSIEFNKVWADTTLSNFRKIGAVYIETDSPIPVTQLK